MPLTMTLAVLEMALSAEECIVAATVNAAHALGIAGQTGSLETGKRADAIILNVPHYEELPYQVGRDLVRDVIIGGKFAKRDGRLLLDVE
jgi:imidazolonepropionase